MTDVTLIGLGAMGSALAKALMAKQVTLTVWNRSTNPLRAIVNAGANPAASIDDAVSASPRVFLCLREYANARELLDHKSTRALLAGRNIVQLSTGTPREVRDMARWVTHCGARYLDASVMVYPYAVGTAAGQLLASGSEEVFRECDTFLRCFGDDVRYLGSNVSAAAALDLAVISRLTATTPAVVHGTLLCESEGVPLQQYADMFAEGDRARSVVLAIQRDNFDDDIAASVDTAIGCISSIKRQADESGINSELPSFLLKLYQRAVDSGYRERDAASLIKVLRANPKH